LDVDAHGRARDAPRVHLAELLVAAALLGLVLAAIVGLLTVGQQASAIAAGRVEAQQSARFALQRMAREIRTAGHGGGAFAAIAVAEPERLVLQVDVNGDGLIAGRGETVTWRLAGTVLRRDAGGGAQPVINGVRALRFTYRDADGRETAVADDVRAVVIALTAAPDHSAPGRIADVAAAVTTQVRLRNR
jgi:type II secretory pathway component PulJ